MASLPRCRPAELSSRLGQHALAWQAIARGEDTAPLVPTLPEERFESSLELEWPVEGLEPLSFVLTRLLEPLSARLERRDRGAAILHLELRLVDDSLGTGVGRRAGTHAICSCRRRFATCGRSARSCCSISNRTRRRPPSIA